MHWKDLKVWKKAHAKDLGYIEDEVYKEFEREYELVSKMLHGLIKSLKLIP